jgi:uncharacterized LabA/DUF88 family protein
VSGDGDFVPLVEYLQDHSGVQVEVVSFGKSTSAKLKEAADSFVDLGDSPEKYLMRRSLQVRGRGPRGVRPRGDSQSPTPETV